MNLTEGTILSLDPATCTARVRVGKHEECSGCGACGGAQQLVLDAVCRIPCKEGDHVEVRMVTPRVVWSAFIVFVLPLLIAALGAYLGYRMGEDEMYPIYGGGAFFLLGCIIVTRIDRNVQKKSARPEVLRIL